MKQTKKKTFSEVGEIKETQDIWVADEKLIEYLDHYYKHNPPPKLSWIERLYKLLKRS